MKRLVCLLYAMGIVGCGNPMPDMPPYLGEKDGIRYYADSDLNISLEGASTQVKLIVEAFGADMGSMQGVSIGYTTQDFLCGEEWSNDGCYINDPPVIRVQTFNRHCPYFAPMTHEIWHHLINFHREPNAEEREQIAGIQREVILQLVRPYCHW